MGIPTECVTQLPAMIHAFTDKDEGFERNLDKKKLYKAIDREILFRNWPSESFLCCSIDLTSAMKIDYEKGRTW